MPSTFNRSDTMLGVCQALGEDFGFDPLWLRIAFAAGLFWNPLAMVCGYLALFAAITAVQWLTPARAAMATPVMPAADVANDDVIESDRLAA